jgi:hypothetical protein
MALEDLVNPFTVEEFVAIVRNLKADKSPGPDGFNTNFIKKSVGKSLSIISMSYAQASSIMIFVCRASMDLTLP